MNPLARLIFPSLRWRARTGFDHERPRIEQTLALGVGGYILFGGTAEAARALIREIRSAAAHALLFGADFERGVGQQFAEATHLPPPAALGFVGDPALTGRCGHITAVEASYAGINWVYAPVCDLDIEPNNPIIQTRSFGDEPQAVSAQASSWVVAAEAGGVATAPKHYPGHGRTAADSHATLPEVDVPLAVLAATDLQPFAAAVAAGARSVMSAHVAFPAWDARRLPASLSAPILRHLRTELGFDGVIVTDALIMEGALRGRGAAAAAVAAVAAGGDALLYPSDAALVAAALERAAGGELGRARVDQALARITYLAEALAGPSETPPDLAEHATFADALADITLHVLRGDRLTLRSPLEITVVDDDVGGPYAVGPRDLFEQRLRELGIPTGRGGSRVVLVYAEPRSWKGRALLGSPSVTALGGVASTTALTILFGHPRLEAQLPASDSTPVLCAWHGQPLMQHAAARWVAARLR